MMGRHPIMLDSSASRSESDPDSEAELQWPFGQIDSLSRNDLRDAAYELFFMSCRSSPGFASNAGGARHTVPPPSPSASPAPSYMDLGEGRMGVMGVTSRIKKALGLKRGRASSLMRPMTPAVAAAGVGKVKRPMTSAEIMRQQMHVTEQSENRLRKTLMRTLVGQMGRRAETVILPLELLRQLKPSEFNDMHEYHMWQRRQLKILEAGLLLHPSVPLDRLNSAALRLRDIIRSSEIKPIDTTKNSEAMRALCNCVVSLAWRSQNGTPAEACHWADGFPMNVHLYLMLLQSIFDLRDETVVLDEVDELIELMKKTWNTLGINRVIHNVCFTWVLFQQYVITGQIEPDLMSATLAMLVEVANDAKRTERELSYVKVLSGTLVSMQGWAEKKLSDYHESFEKGNVGNMESVLSLVLTTAKIISEDVSSMPGSVGLVERDNAGLINSLGNRVDYFIRCSMKNAFTRILENGNGNVDSMVVEVDEDPSDVLIQLAKDTEELALIERETYSPTLKRWQCLSTSIAVVTLHNCFGVVLKQYLARVNSLTNELVQVLQSAGKLEKALVQMVVEDSAECDDGGKGILKEMIPYEVDSIIMNLLKTWIEERLRIGRECLSRAKETESWMPKSKAEPFAQSAVDLVKLAKVTVDEFFEIPVGARDDLVQDLADGLESLFQEYTTFVASCGSRQSYIPTLPPLTRCNQDSRVAKLWKKASMCKTGGDVVGGGGPHLGPGGGAGEGHHHNPRSSTSRGTQRLYIRLNTLHFLLSHLHSLDKSLSFFSSGAHHGPSPSVARRRLGPSNHFDLARSSLLPAIHHVSEVSAFRLIFLDSRTSFYDSLYVGDVASSRIRPALRILKQNLTLLIAVLTDRAQPLAVREVMKASFEVFLMVLLAGGSERAFVRSDYEMISEDFKSLKRLFCTCGEGLVQEEVVDREAEVVEGIIGLMGQPTERLVEEFSSAACEASGLGGFGGAGQRVPMPPTTGRWNRADPNTVLRVLCYRNDEASSNFLKRTFQLAKRR